MTIVVWFILGLASAQSVISNGTVTTESPIIPVAPSWKNEYLRDVYAEPLGSMVRISSFLIFCCLYVFKIVISIS